MKRFYLLLFSLLISLMAVSQVVIKSDENRYGIYNSHTKKWEVDPFYLKIREIGIYDGRQYFAVCSEKGHKWGVIRSDKYKQWYLPPQLEDVECYPGTDMFSSIPILCVREKGGWGIIELGSGEFWYIRKGQYKSIRLDSSEEKFLCQNWDSSQPDEILNDYDLKRAYEYVQSAIAKRTGTPIESPQTTSAGKTNMITKPTCQILSPATGSTYETNTIRLRYTTNLSPGSYFVTFEVNGDSVQPIHTGVEKGAKIEQGIEVELPMPQTLGKEAKIQIHLQDMNGIWADPQTIKLMYVGPKAKPTLHIFAVGISEYQAADLENLKYADKDAQDFVKAIMNSDLHIMYGNIDRTVILNQEATANYIRTKLTELKDNVKQDDVVMLFFSGHGINENEESYFVTNNVLSAKEYYNGVEFDFIRKRMTDMVNKHSHVIVFMDACHSGAMFGTKGNTKGITFATPGVIGFYSSTSGEKSVEIDDLGNGVFTSAILNAINGNIANEEGEITTQQLWDYVVKYVREKTGGNQTPISENNIGEYVLLHVKKNNP